MSDSSGSERPAGDGVLASDAPRASVRRPLSANSSISPLDLLPIQRVLLPSAGSWELELQDC